MSFSNNAFVFFLHFFPLLSVSTHDKFQHRWSVFAEFIYFHHLFQSHCSFVFLWGDEYCFHYNTPAARETKQRLDSITTKWDDEKYCLLSSGKWRLWYQGHVGVKQEGLLVRQVKCRWFLYTLPSYIIHLTDPHQSTHCNHRSSLTQCVIVQVWSPQIR